MIRKTALILTAIIVFSCLPFGAASADSTWGPMVKLDWPRAYSSAVWTGDYAYVFGGKGGGYLRGSILRVDPASRTVVRSEASLGTFSMIESSAVWSGNRAYIIGGIEYSTYSSRIVAYDPAADTLSGVGEMLLPISGTSAVWAEGKAYIFGGLVHGGYESRISGWVQRFDPATGNVDFLPEMNSRRNFSGAAWDGRNAYIFGGGSCEIERFDPVTGTTTLTGAKLCLGNTAAVFDGYNFLVFSGRDIFRYSPDTNSVTRMSARLDGPDRIAFSAVWAAGYSLQFGGEDCRNGYCTYFDDVSVYELTPGAPQNLAASTLPMQGVSVKWNPPASNTYSAPLEGYVLEAVDITAFRTRVITIPSNQTTFVDTQCRLGKLCSYRLVAFNAQARGFYSPTVYAAGS